MIHKFLVGTVILLVLSFFVFPNISFAHGTAISSSKVVGDYKIEFEYNVPQIIAGETNSYIFRLLNNKTGDFVSFDSLLVRFEDKKDQSTVFVVRVTQDELQDGVGRFTAMINKGDYNITLGFYKTDNKVAETNFDLTVWPPDEDKKFPTIPFATGVVGLVLGFIASNIISRSSLNGKK